MREKLAFLPSASSCAFPSSPLGQLWHTLNQLVKQAEKHTGNKREPVSPRDLNQLCKGSVGGRVAEKGGGQTLSLSELKVLW